MAIMKIGSSRQKIKFLSWVSLHVCNLLLDVLSHRIAYIKLSKPESLNNSQKIQKESDISDLAGLDQTIFSTAPNRKNQFDLGNATAKADPLLLSWSPSPSDCLI